MNRFLNISQAKSASWPMLLLGWAVLCLAVTNARADLVALYRFEGSATADVPGASKLGAYTGLTYNGTASGTTAIVADASGVNGGTQSLSLDGTGGKVSLPASFPNPFDGTHDYTITCWFKLPTFSRSAQNDRIILSSARDNNGSNHSMAFFVAIGTRSGGDGDLRTDNYNVSAIGSGSSLDDDGWHFGAVTYLASSQTFQVRSDSTYSSAGSFDPSIPGIASDTVVIGGSLNPDFPLVGDYSGELDDVAIFDHQLSNAELDNVRAGNFSAYLTSAPEIDVTGNGVSIASGDTTPSTADHTDFGTTASGGGTLTRTFTITNSGTAALNLTGTPAIQISGADAAQFTVKALTVPSGSLTVVNPGFETPAYSPGDFNYLSGLDSGWTYGGQAGVAHNGSPWYVNSAPEGTQAAFIQSNGSGAYVQQDINFPAAGSYDVTFWFVRRSAGYPGNDLDVRMDGSSIGTLLSSEQPDDTWAEVTYTYNCPSAGSHTLAFVGLHINDFDTAIDDVRVTGSSAQIAAGAAATFQIEYAPSATGTHAATITIGNDDSDEGSYTFDITGTGITAGPQDWTADTGNGNGAGNGTSDSLHVRLNGANIEFSSDGGTTWTATLPYATTTVLTLTGSSDDDTFAIDFSGGNPIPSGGLVIVGAGQVSAGDAITLTGGSHTTVTYGFVNNNDGSIDIDGSLITYTGLEPVTDNSDAVNRVFDFTGGAETITITSVSGTQTRVDSTLGEVVTFNNPTGSMTINAGTGDDIIALDGLSPGWGGAVTITLNGDDGNDQFALSKTVATAAPITVNGGAHTIADTINFGQEGDAGITSSGASPGTISGGTPAIQTVNYDTVETVTMISSGIQSNNLIIADRGPYFNTGTIILIDTNAPVTQTVLNTTLKDPYDLDLDAAGDIVVADYENGGADYGIFKINKTSLIQTTISTGGSLVVPFGLKVDKTGGVNDGKYIVGDLDADNDGLDEWGAIFVIDPGAASPGNQTILSSRTVGTGPAFHWITALALGSAGDIYVCDQGDTNNPGVIPPRIFHVDPATGNRTVITTTGDTLEQPIGIVVVAETGTSPAGATLAIVDGFKKRVIVLTIPPTYPTFPTTSGVQAELLQTGASFTYPTHVAVDGLDYIITDAPPGAVAGQRQVHRIIGGVSGGTPVAETITSDGFLEQPRGVVVVP